MFGEKPPLRDLIASAQRPCAPRHQQRRQQIAVPDGGCLGAFLAKTDFVRF